MTARVVFPYAVDQIHPWSKPTEISVVTSGFILAQGADIDNWVLNISILTYRTVPYCMISVGQPAE